MGLLITGVIIICVKVQGSSEMSGMPVLTEGGQEEEEEQVRGLDSGLQ